MQGMSQICHLFKIKILFKKLLQHLILAKRPSNNNFSVVWGDGSVRECLLHKHGGFDPLQSTSETRLDSECTPAVLAQTGRRLQLTGPSV